MRKRSSILRIKTILILVVITPSITALSYLFFVQSPTIIYNITNYFCFQESVIISPEFSLDIFWFLTDDPLISLTLPQVLDIILIIWIIFNIQFPLCPAIKKYHSIKDSEYSFDCDLYYYIGDENQNESVDHFEHLNINNSKLSFTNKINKQNLGIKNNKSIEDTLEKKEQKHHLIHKKLPLYKFYTTFPIIKVLNLYHIKKKIKNSNFSHNNHSRNTHRFLALMMESPLYFKISDSSSDSECNMRDLIAQILINEQKKPYYYNRKTIKDLLFKENKIHVVKNLQENNLWRY
ncbi:MAG: hypothetical protein GF329_12425 [Candidatus Lokiarchaeota archaeon]|nr:hypothetical protein [Candidatus Lokiarchaeota archaeon]